MNDLYILDDEWNPVPCNDVVVWGRWFETADRVVACDVDEREESPYKGQRISTVFIGLDHRFGRSGPPILWETLVFGGPLDGEMDRYTSLDEARKGHHRMCQRVLDAQRPGKQDQPQTPQD